MAAYLSSSRNFAARSAEKIFTPLRQHRKKVLGLGAILLIVVVGVPVLRSRTTTTDTATEVSAEVLPVETLTAEVVDSYDVMRTYTGEIVALRASDLGFERGGELISVLVQEGDVVSVGMPLARLDISNLQTQRQQLEAERARASAQLAELEAGPRIEDIATAEANVREIEQQLVLQSIQLSRREYLYAEGAISKESLDEFAYGEEVLQARLDQARSNLQELRNGTRQEQILAQQAAVKQLDAAIADLDVTIGKSTLRSPFAGIVSARQIDEGTVVGAGQSIVRIVENVAPEARVGMPIDVASELRVGDIQMVDLGADVYTATITALLPEVDPETRTQVVVLQLEQATVSQISPGQTVRVDMTETIASDGIWLPTTALTQDVRGLWSAYVLVSTKEDDTVYEVQPQTVEILHQEENRTLVRGTVQQGDRIVSSGIHRLTPGQQVQPI
ncbi:MAG: efflux RND transporter periplasmic adaptor subunit [Cyanobacteria bacterium P01_H01_bin.21]